MVYLSDTFRRFQVLEHRDFRAVSGTPREALQAQARLEELPPGPWQQQAQPRSRAAIRVACGAKPGVELQEVGVEGPMDHQDQCWTLDQAGPW